MDKNQYYKIGLDLTYLASCAIHGITPDKKRIQEMNLADVQKMAKRHHLSSISYLSLMKAYERYPDLEKDEQVLAPWRKEYHINAQRLLQLDMEREVLTAFLRENNIWYLCLKGVVLQRYYPALGMREMTDNDILVDPEKCEIIRDYFVSRGYEVLSYKSGWHDSYRKIGAYFEIHRMLTADNKKTHLAYNYYSNIKDMLLPTDNGSELVFSLNDFYVYFIFHSYKHFINAGCGLRTLMDISVYSSANKDKLDRSYIESQLKAMGTYQYELDAGALAEKLFSIDPDDLYSMQLDEDEMDSFLYYVSSGTFGTQKHHLKRTIDEFMVDGKIPVRNKLKYICGRVFPGKEFYRTHYPVAYKLKFPIPFIWFVRLFRVFTQRKRIATEVKYLNKKR